MCQKNFVKIYSEKIITVCNAVYLRLCIDLTHITPAVTAEGYDGSHHPRYAEWYHDLTSKIEKNRKKLIYMNETFLDTKYA